MRMVREVPRRHVFYAGLAATLLAGACGTSRRRSGRLTYLLRREPNTLDPAKSPGGSEALDNLRPVRATAPAASRNYGADGRPGHALQHRA